MHYATAGVQIRQERLAAETVQRRVHARCVRRDIHRPNLWSLLSHSELTGGQRAGVAVSVVLSLPLQCCYRNMSRTYTVWYDKYNTVVILD